VLATTPPLAFEVDSYRAATRPPQIIAAANPIFSIILITTALHLTPGTKAALGWFSIVAVGPITMWVHLWCIVGAMWLDIRLLTRRRDVCDATPDTMQDAIKNERDEKTRRHFHDPLSTAGTHERLTNTSKWGHIR
jgi:hypothetical protein